MALIVPNEGERELLRRIFNTADKKTGPVKVGLFGDQTVYVSDLMTMAIILDPANLFELQTSVDASYSRKTVESTHWDITTSGSGLASIKTANQVEFILTGGDTEYAVYGYFVCIEETPDTDSQLLWYELFPSAFTIQTAVGGGGTIKLILKLELE